MPNLTILAILILPFEIALLVARGMLVASMLTAAHLENLPVVFGLDTHHLVSFSLPAFQMIAFSAYFLMSAPPNRQRHGHLRTLAALLWVTVSILELAVCVPALRVEAIYRLLMTAVLILMDTFGGAIVLEHLVCPWWRNRR